MGREQRGKVRKLFLFASLCLLLSVEWHSDWDLFVISGR
jgi:hypothetical protein